MKKKTDADADTVVDADKAPDYDVLIPLAEMMRICGYPSKPGVYAAIKRGEAPQPVKVGKRANAFSLKESLAVQRQKIAERDARLAAKAKARAEAEKELLGHEKIAERDARELKRL